MLRHLLACVIVVASVYVQASEPDACGKVEQISLPDLTVEKVETLDEPVPHCKLTGKVGREIGFSVWLPVDWNGKFVMGGGGGFVGSIQNQALALGALQRGYATAGTDTGHQANGIDGSWALHNLERIANYGHVAIHRVSEVAKHITDRHYDKWPDRSYFAGCSNGGRQAMAFSQRYPEDFNAILAGAPAFDFGGVAAAFVNVTQHMYPDMDDLSSPLLSPDDRTLLSNAVLEQCDAKDGLTDGIMNDPRDCDFDVDSLDLSPDKKAAIRAVYDGPQNDEGSVFHGWPVGGENEDGGWGWWLAGPGQQTEGTPPSAAFGFGVDLMRYMVEHDPDWRYEGFSFNDYRERVAPVESVLSAKDPNLDKFRDAGGKLLFYHGWSDAALSALATVDYVDAVYARDPTARDDVRLFLMPGVSHCAGGPGPWMVDLLEVIDEWTATDTAPDELIAGFADEGGARRLCAYPKKAIYTGGNDRSPESFECR